MAARVNSRKCASYHLVHLLKITPVALRVRVRIPNETVGSGPSLPFQPLLPAGLPSPLWPSSISFLRAFVSAVPSAWSTLPHHFQLANVNQVSDYLSSPKRTLLSPSTSAPSPFSLYLLPQCPWRAVHVTQRLSLSLEFYFCVLICLLSVFPSRAGTNSFNLHYAQGPGPESPVKICRAQ